MSKGWIGVDLDGTLAHYDNWKAQGTVIGAPLLPMVTRVRTWLQEGKHVKIFTARVSDPEEASVSRPLIEAWCLEHLGRVLEITCCKDYYMVELWDDRAIQVEHNTGRIIGDGS